MAKVIASGKVPVRQASKLKKNIASAESKKKTRQAYARYKKDEEEKKKNKVVTASQSTQKKKETERQKQQGENWNNAKQDVKKKVGGVVKASQSSSKSAYDTYKKTQPTNDSTKAYQSYLQKEKEKKKTEGQTWKTFTDKTSDKINGKLDSTIRGKGTESATTGATESKKYDSNGVKHDPENPTKVKTNLYNDNKTAKDKATKDINEAYDNAFGNHYAFKQMFGQGMSDEESYAIFKYYQEHPDEANSLKMKYKRQALDSAYKDIDAEMPAFADEKYLTADETVKVMTNNNYNPELRRKALKNGNPELAEKLGDVQAQNYFTRAGRVSQGFLEGSAMTPIMSANGVDNTGAVYNDNAKKFIQAGQNSIGYNVGMMGGMLGAGVATGTTGLEGALAKTIAKSGAKSTAKTVFANGVADLVVNSPIDIIDSIKSSYGEDGKIDPNELIKNLGINFGASALLGGVGQGAGSLFKTAQIQKLGSVINKMNKGISLDEKDLKFLRSISSKEETGFTGYDNAISKAQQKEAYYGLNGIDDVNIANKRISDVSNAVAKVNGNYVPTANSGLRSSLDSSFASIDGRPNVKVGNPVAPYRRKAILYGDDNLDSVLEKSKKDFGVTYDKALDTEYNGRKVLGNTATFKPQTERIDVRGKKFVAYEAIRDNKVTKDEFINAMFKKVRFDASDKDMYATFKNRMSELYDVMNRKGFDPNKDLPEHIPYNIGLRPTNKHLTKTVGHETSHTVTKLLGEKKSEELYKSALAYAKTQHNGEIYDYDSLVKWFEGYKKKGKEGEYINTFEDEATAEIVGSYLYTDADFIKSLRSYNPPLFAKLYEFIVTRYDALIGKINERNVRNNPEALLLEKFKNEYRKAYFEATKTIKNLGNYEAPTIHSKPANAINGGSPNELHNRAIVDDEVQKSSKPSTIKPSEVATSIYRKVFNDLQGIERLAKTFKTKELRERFRAVTNDMRKAYSVADNSINGDERYSYNGKPSGKSLSKIYREFSLDKDAKKLEKFDRYALLVNHIESSKLGKPIFDLSVDDAKKEIAQLKKEFPRTNGKADGIEDFHKEIVGYGKFLLEYRRDAGLISQKQFDYFTKRMPNYVPAFREGFIKNADDVDFGDDIFMSNGIWERKGSNKPVAPLFNSLSTYTHLTVQSANTNRVMDAVFDVAQTSGKGKGDFKVHFFKDGESVEMSVDRDIYYGMKDFSNQNRSSVYKFLDENGYFDHNPLPALNNAYKELITDYNILFGVRNVTKDNLTAVVFTQNIRGYIANLPEAIRQITTNGEVYKLYMASGGRFSNFVNGKGLDYNVKGFKKFMSSTVEGKFSPLRWATEVNNFLETIPRMSEFTSALKEFGGDDIIEDLSKLSKDDISRAMYRANDITTNFSRNGKWGRTANRNFVPFLNASLQGMDKLRRVFSETAENGLFSKEMAGLVGKFTAFAIAPSLANELLNAGNEDFQWLTDRDKDNYYCIPLGDGEFIKIPKARETSVVAMPMNYILRYGMYGKANGDEPITEWKNLCDNAWELAGVINPWTDNIFSGAINVARNRTYWGGEINYEDDMKLIADGENWKAYDENTSAVAKWLGAENRLNRSPKSIDRLMDNYLGFIYDMGIKPTAMKYYSSSDSKTEILRNWAVNIGKSNFMIDALFSSKPADNYFAKLDSSDPVTNKEMNQTYTGDISLYSSGIHEMLALDKNTAEKTKDARELRRLRMQVYKDGVHGDFNNANPINDLCKFFGIKHVFTSHEYMNVDDDHKGSSYYGWFDNLIKTDEYKNNPKKYEKEFLDVYNSSHKIARKIGIGDLYPDSELLALDIVNNKRSGVVVDSITKDFFDDTMDIAKNYLGQYGRSINDYIKTQKGLIKSARTLGYDYIGEMSSAQKSVAIANNNPNASDTEYYVSGCGMRTYQGRAVATKYNWTDDKFDKFLKDNGLDKATLKEKGIDEITPAMAKKAVDSANCKSTAEASALYSLLVTRFVKDNPYGASEPMPVSGDVGIKNNYYAKGGFGYRRYGRGHRGWHNYSNKYSQFNNYDIWLKKHGQKSSGSSSKSNLNGAFRQRQLKMLQSTSGTLKTK